MAALPTQHRKYTQYTYLKSLIISSSMPLKLFNTPPFLSFYPSLQKERRGRLPKERKSVIHATKII